MTYRDSQDVYELEWPSWSTLAGLVVKATATSLAAAAAVERFNARALGSGTIRAKDIVRLAEAFIPHVTEWTLRLADGRPAPVTVAAFVMFDRAGVVEPVVMRWAELVVAPPVAELEPDPVPVAEWTAPAPEPETEQLFDGVSVDDLEARMGSVTAKDPQPGMQLVAVHDQGETVTADLVSP
jgi:hypothetical protein